MIAGGSAASACSPPASAGAAMKLSRQFTVFGSAIFCVVIFSLYLMLDRGHLDHPKNHRRESSFPQVSGKGGALAAPYTPPPPVVGRGAKGSAKEGRFRFVLQVRTRRTEIQTL